MALQPEIQAHINANIIINQVLLIHTLVQIMLEKLEMNILAQILTILATMSIAIKVLFTKTKPGMLIQISKTLEFQSAEMLALV